MRTHTPAPSGRKRALAALGSLAAVAALVTAAAFTDFANLNLGSGTDDTGLGGNNAFNIQVVGTDNDGNPVVGTWQEADTVEGVDIRLAGADLLTPDETVSVEIPFRNASPVLGAAITFSLQDRPGYVSDEAMTEALRFTVSLDGQPLLTDVTQAAVDSLDLGSYTPDEDGVLKISVTLPDQGSEAANNALNGLVSYVQAHFDATSVQP